MVAATIRRAHHADPARTSPSYTRRRPEASVLYRVLQRNLATFLSDAEQAQEGTGLPQFVQKELRAFLKCGVLAHGFSRFRCTDCKFERLVPLSCKGRGFCPSCGGKRMTDTAAYLTDHVVPFVPVRQFVLSFPHWLRYRLAYDHDRCTAVLKIFMRAVLSYYRHRARLQGVQGGRSGSVTFVQRFGSAANLNLRHLERHGLLLDDQADPFSDESPLLASCYATSITHRQTLGKGRGARLKRAGDPDATRAEHRAPHQAHLDRFDLHAGLTIAAQHPHGRVALEKLLRYCARPPIAQDRLSEIADGSVALQLKTPWADGTTHVIYEPLDLIAKLAALIPRPHKNLILYHGVLAANAAWRGRVVAYGRNATQSCTLNDANQPELGHHRRRQWADLMRRAFGYDLLSCPNCGGKMQLLACIMERGTIRKILIHLRLPPDPPSPAPARASPDTWDQLDTTA